LDGNRLTAAVKNICVVKSNTWWYTIRNRRWHTMATKTANVTARIQPNIKEQAEAILDRLGIPVSVFIDMTYRQVIMRDGVPFSLDIPDKLVTRDSITQAEFDTMMQTGLAQAKKNDSVSVDEAFNQLKSEI
jgi:DNA-damage-inducible protein J